MREERDKTYDNVDEPEAKRGNWKRGKKEDK